MYSSAQHVSVGVCMLINYYFGRQIILLAAVLQKSSFGTKFVYLCKIMAKTIKTLTEKQAHMYKIILIEHIYNVII